jgi:hypothetical protein
MYQQPCSGSLSGGTLSTIFSIFDVFSLKELEAANAPYAISPIPGPKGSYPAPWTTRLFGVRSIPELGTLTTYMMSVADIPQVQRTWGLLSYGPNFRFHEYMRTKSVLSAMVIHFGLLFSSILLAFRPVRDFVKKHVTQPGNGPTKEQTKNQSVVYRAIAQPDVKYGNRRAFCTAEFQGSAYER